MTRISIFLFVLLAFGCKPDKKYVKLYGETMGTYYALTFEPEKEIHKETIDEILIAFNHSLSTYEPESVIGRFNRSTDGVSIPAKDTFFIPVLKKAQEFYQSTDGLYDPTVQPLVNYWGFSYGEKKAHLGNYKVKVDSLRQYIGMHKVSISDKNGATFVQKSQSNVQLDFSSIAKGFAIDIVADYLESQGVNNYLVDIGGEARAKGVNASQKVWTLGINKPKETSEINEFEVAVKIDNQSIATSGNYRNVYTVDGTKVSHTINPKTGYPERSNLLSATVLTDKCMDADGIATALMVMGFEKAKTFLTKYKIDALLIYGNEDGKMERYSTSGFSKYIVQ